MNESQCTAVVSDTTHYLPSALVEELGIHLVSLYVNIGGEQLRDLEIDDYDDFYERLRSTTEAATTSQPSVGEFIETYEPLLAEGRDVVSVHLSSGISGTFGSAAQAKEQLTREGKGGERIFLYDSESAAGGYGMTVVAAGRAALAGEDGAGCVARARATRENLKMWFAVDTLEYLRRGGRIGAASAWIGSTLRIKPILTFEREVAPVERVRTRARAFERLVDYARERSGSGIDGWVVQHIQAKDTADDLIEKATEIFGCEPIFTSEVGPVLGVHAGPGMLGIGSSKRELMQ